MLYLQGDSQKAVVFSELAKSNEFMIISNQHLSMDIDYYQYQDIHDVEEQIREVLLKKEEVRWILLYTNEQKENLKRETWFLQVLEREGMIMNSIIACK